jgi:cold shock CspA family protein
MSLEATMPIGTIRKIIPDRGGFGYIVPDDGSVDVHFNLRTFPQAREGQRVKYELEVPQPARGPHATTVEVEDGSAPTVPTPSASPPTRSGELGVKIEVGTVKSIVVEEKVGDTDEVRMVTYLRLPVLVSLSRGNQQVKDVEVIMEPTGVNKTRNGWDAFYSNPAGEVYFQVLVPEDADDTILTVRVGGKDYSELWEKTPTPKSEPLPPTEAPPTATPDPPKPTEPPKIAKAIRAFELGRGEDGYTTFRIMTLTEDNGAEGVADEFFVESADLLEDVDGETEKSHSMSYDSDEQGQDIVRIRPVTASEAQVYFRLAKNPAKSTPAFRIVRKEEPATPTADADTTESTVTSDPPKPTEPPKVQKLSQTVEGVYTLLVQTTPNTEVTLEGIPVLVRQGTDWGKKTTFTSDDKGNLEIEVKVEHDGDRGDLIFCAGGFRSKPQYVVHPKRPTK